MTQLHRTSRPFGERLAHAITLYGPFCLGIDPYEEHLLAWGYNNDVEGVELFSMRMLQAARGHCAIVKFQISMFERYGSAGYSALERVLYTAKSMGFITILDVDRGGISSTLLAYAQAYLHDDSPLSVDAITLMPYYGFRSLIPIIQDALEHHRGVFIAALTSNPEGCNLQSAIRQRGEYAGQTVAYGIAAHAQKSNIGVKPLGSVGMIIGATSGDWMESSGINPAIFTGPILAPGYGWHGASAEELQRLFAGTQGNVLASAAQSIAMCGPDLSHLSQAIDALTADIRSALHTQA